MTHRPQKAVDFAPVAIVTNLLRRHVPRSLVLAFLLLPILKALGQQREPASAVLTRSITLRTPESVPPLAEVTGAAIDDQRRLIVLDGRQNALRVYAPDGALIAKTASPGMSSGVRVPVGVVVDGQNHVSTFDVATHRLYKYRLEKENVQLADSAGLKLEAFDLCAMHGRFYLLGLHEGQLIHQVTAGGKIVRSFGEPFGGDHEMLRRSLARGRIACFPERRMIVIASTVVPNVRAYRDDGRLVWQDSVVGAKRVNVVIRSATSVSYQRPPAGYHVTASLQSLGQGGVLLQLGLVTAQHSQPGDYAAVESRILDVATGRELGRQTSLPRVIAVGKQRLATTGGTPLPTVTIHDYAFRGSRDK